MEGVEDQISDNEVELEVEGEKQEERLEGAERGEGEAQERVEGAERGEGEAQREGEGGGGGGSEDGEQMDGDETEEDVSDAAVIAAAEAAAVAAVAAVVVPAPVRAPVAVPEAVVLGTCFDRQRTPSASSVNLSPGASQTTPIRNQTIPQSQSKRKTGYQGSAKKGSAEKKRKYMQEKRTAESPNTASKRRESSRKHMAELRQTEQNKTPQKVRKLRNAVRKQLRLQVATAYSTPEIGQVAKNFEMCIEDGPIYICTICHRLLYRKSVNKCTKGMFKKLDCNIIKEILSEKYERKVGESSWICHTCKSHMGKGLVPLQAKMNGLNLDDIPEELKDLNSLEVHLLAKRLTFKKLVGLPRGQQQSIHGPVVNCPADVQTTCTLLPRIPENSHLIPLKLKRKLVYKGHYMHQYIRPEKIIIALQWLRENNPLYSDVSINESWQDEWSSEDSSFWEALVNDKHSHEDSDNNIACEKSCDVQHNEVIDLSPADTNIDATTEESDQIITCEESCDVPHNKVNDSVPDMSHAENEQSINTESEFINHGENTHEPASPNISQNLVIPEHISISIVNSQCISEIRKLEQIASSINLLVHNVPGDGNCLYHAVGYHLERMGYLDSRESEPLVLRRRLSQFMEENATVNDDHYRNYIPGGEAIVQNSSDIELPSICDSNIDVIEDDIQRLEVRWQRYLDRLENGAWGDHLALQGLSDLFQITVNVVCTTNANIVVIKPRIGLGNEAINLGLMGQSHYTALVENRNEIRCETQNANERETNKPQSNDECEDPCKEDVDEFERASKLRGLPFNSLLQPDDAEGMDRTYSIAPSEGKVPMTILSDENFEPLAFPHLFPKGFEHFNSLRDRKLTIKKYFNQRLLDADGRFSKDIDYLLAAQYITEQKDVGDKVNIAMRQLKGQNSRGRAVTAEMVRNPGTLKSLFQDDRLFKCLRQIRGSPPYWAEQQKSLMAMVRQLGKPTWFLTLSAADLNWPNPIKSIAKQYGIILSNEDVSEMTWEDKCRWLRTNPITAARSFAHRVDSFFKEFLLSSAHPVGEVTAHFIRHEFQARGSPHVHTLLWCKNAPELGVDSDEEVISFVDKYQTCSSDGDDSFKNFIRLQTHVHSKTCRKYGICRFHFPHLPSENTVIAKEVETNDLLKTKEVLKKIYITMHDEDKMNRCTNQSDLLTLSGVSREEYENSLKQNKSGNKILLRRKLSDVWINQYNRDILQSWKANMDFQYVIDAYACVMYIVSYLLKAEQGMSDVLRQVSKQTKDDDLRTQLRKIGAAFLTHREVSAQEAAYRLLSIPLKQASHQVVFVNTNTKEQRVSLLKSKSELESLDGENENIFQTSFIDKYVARPNSLENISLAQFSAEYATSGSSSGCDEEDPDNEINHQSSGKKIMLKNGLGGMRKRKTDAVIRFYNFSTSKDEDSKFRHRIMLYYPWRNEEIDLINGFETFKEHHDQEAVNNIIIENEKKYTKSTDNLDDLLQDLHENGPQQHAWDDIAPGAEEQNEIANNEGEIAERHIEDEDLAANADMIIGNRFPQTDIHLKFSHEATKGQMSPQEYREKVKLLNPKQRSIVEFNRSWCLEGVRNLKCGKSVVPYYVFLSGPGGVGKSHVIKIIHHDSMRILKKSGTFQPDDVPVLLLGPTGSSAFAINGMTIHTALSIPCQSGKRYQPLSAEKLHSIRLRLQKLQLIIIDECSMVGCELFFQIHRRLQDIKDCDNFFGGVSVLCVGDLYQLRPVLAAYIFEEQANPLSSLYGSLWKENFQLHELTEIVRQKDDKHFGEILNRVRVQKQTKEDEDVLRSREIQIDDNKYFENNLSGELHIYATNIDVNNHNEKELRKLNDLYQIEAIDSCKDEQTKQLLVNLPDNPSKTGGLRKILKVAVTARVVLTYNIDVSLGLVNGACGTITDIERQDNRVHKIWVKFDSKRVGSHNNSISIERICNTFNLGRNKGVEVTRKQFPLSLSWAETIHKTQGKTVDKIVVCMNKGRFSAGQAYVALSRVTTLSGLFINGFNPNKISMAPQVAEEMIRLQTKQLQWNEFNLPDINNQIKIGWLNIAGFLQKRSFISEDRSFDDCDIICLGETWLKSEHEFHPNSINQNHQGSVIRLDRENVPGMENMERGGILVWISKTVKFVHHAVKLPFESIVIEIMTGDQRLYVISVYKSPRIPFQTLKNAFCDLLKQLKPIPIAVVGDFNCDILSKTSETEAFFEATDSYRRLDSLQ